MTKLKAGDYIIGIGRGNYVITDFGWKGIVTQDEDEDGRFAAKSTDPIDKSKYENLDAKFFKIINKQTKPMNNLAAAAKALKRSGPKTEWAVVIQTAIKVTASDEEEAEEIADEDYKSNNAHFISNSKQLIRINQL